MDCTHIFAAFRQMIVNAKPPLTILELGACDGYHTRKLLEILKASGKLFRYFAFEPDTRLREAFAAHVGDLADRVTLINAAVGASDGRQKLWLSEGTGYYGSSSIRQPTGHLTAFPRCTFRESETDVITLDSFAAANQIDRVNFIWSDIQGAEVDMIAGGQRTLAGTEWLYTECDPGLYDGDIGERAMQQSLPGPWISYGRMGGNLLLHNEWF